MTTQPSTGCIVCGAPVEFPEYTLLCNKCDDENLRYAEEQYRDSQLKGLDNG
jgi:predicted nucleic acid-binding Zn ribbon protein